MIRSEALITSSAIDTTMIAMTCNGTRAPTPDGKKVPGGGGEPEGCSSAPAGALPVVSVILDREGFTVAWKV